MATGKATEFFTGKLYWARVLGDPRVNYNEDGREWGFEIELNEDAISTLKKHGLIDRVKGRGYNVGTKGQFSEREPFLQMKKTEFSKDGNPNPPIRVYNADDEVWDQNTLIGNESVADVKVDIRHYGPGKKSGIYPVAIRVKELVPFQSTEFGKMGQIEAEADVEAPKKKKKEFVPLIDDEIGF